MKYYQFFLRFPVYLRWYKFFDTPCIDIIFPAKSFFGLISKDTLTIRIFFINYESKNNKICRKKIFFFLFFVEFNVLCPTTVSWNTSLLDGRSKCISDEVRKRQAMADFWTVLTYSLAILVRIFLSFFWTWKYLCPPRNQSLGYKDIK